MSVPCQQCGAIIPAPAPSDALGVVGQRFTHEVCNMCWETACDFCGKGHWQEGLVRVAQQPSRQFTPLWACGSCIAPPRCVHPWPEDRLKELRQMKAAPWTFELWSHGRREDSAGPAAVPDSMRLTQLSSSEPTQKRCFAKNSDVRQLQFHDPHPANISTDMDFFRLYLGDLGDVENVVRPCPPCLCSFGAACMLKTHSKSQCLFPGQTPHTQHQGSGELGAGLLQGRAGLQSRSRAPHPEQHCPCGRGLTVCTKLSHYASRHCQSTGTQGMQMLWLDDSSWCPRLSPCWTTPTLTSAP